MQVTPTELPDVRIVEPRVFSDDRGFFFESYNAPRFEAAGIDCVFTQDNHARSVENTLRGLHYQRTPGQAKLIRVSLGRIWDVAVDIRPDSPTFGRWVAVELSAEEAKMVFIPVGFAHGYAVLSDVADVQYKCSHVYVPEEERGIAYDDPDLAIPWPVTDPILSERDTTNPRLRDVFPR